MKITHKDHELIRHEVARKGQLQGGPHPERYKFLRRKRRVRNVFLPSDDPNSPLNPITADISQILAIAEDDDATTKDFLRCGWLSRIVPDGIPLPITSKCHRVPLGYFTVKEMEIRIKLDAKMKKDQKGGRLFTKKKIKRFFAFVNDWFWYFFGYPPIYPKNFTRPSDFNENDIHDMSKKNYTYPRMRGFPPYKKRKVPRMYDTATHNMLEKSLNLRKYYQHVATTYHYKHSYVLLQTKAFPMWRTPAEIDRARYLFMKYDHEVTGFVSFDDMCKILDRLGNATSSAIRRKEFDTFVNTGFPTKLSPVGRIEFEEFLRVYYILTYKQVGPNRGYPKERRLTPVEIDFPLWTPKAKDKTESTPENGGIRSFPNSFRNVGQSTPISVKHSIYWNMACGLF